MKKKLGNFMETRALISILFVFVLVSVNLVIIMPLTAPKVRGQITHLAGTMDEDGDINYDEDGEENGIVVWSSTEDHLIEQDYEVGMGMTLVIPALNYMFNPTIENEITFTTAGTKIEVYGTLLTNSDGNEMTKTLFWGGMAGISWSGINFRPGSSGNITDCIIDGATGGVHMWTQLMPYSPMTLLSPGITDTTVWDTSNYVVRLSNVVGYTEMDGCTFEDGTPSAMQLRVSGTDLNLRNTGFTGRGANKPSIEIINSDVTAENCYINGFNQPGSLVTIEGDSDGTVFMNTDFVNGELDVPLVMVEGATPFFDNCSFDTSDGEVSVLAHEGSNKVPAHLTLRNPTGDGTPGFWDGSFDNTTMNATGNSTITLQWYLNVNVFDPDGFPIDNAPVTVSPPASPSSKPTDDMGWAEWFTVTELVQYNDSVVYNGPYNITATNNSMDGFADPEPSFDMSKMIYIEVPFNPIPNNIPNVTYISTPTGVQTDLITIDFILGDMDPGDDGNMSIEVQFWDDDFSSWIPATNHSTSDPKEDLNN
ncbi:MAG: hypothetical protein JSW28_06520, partial [Thermoplasmata archaeon]